MEEKGRGGSGNGEGKGEGKGKDMVVQVLLFPHLSPGHTCLQ